MYSLNLHASPFLSMGPIYFFFAKAYAISQFLMEKEVGYHVLFSSQRDTIRPLPPPPGRVCATKLFLWQNTMDLLWNIWGLLGLPCNQDTRMLDGLAGVWRKVVHMGTKVFGFFFLVVQARQQRSSLLPCACVQGNCKVKKEQGPSSRTSGSCFHF